MTDFDLRAIPTPPEFEVAQGPEVANSSAERQFRAWLAVFNQGDQTALLKFFNDSYPSEVGRIEGDLKVVRDPRYQVAKRLRSRTPEVIELR